MWMNSLRLGSIVMFCWLLSGCDTSHTEYVHHGEWVYRNESSWKSHATLTLLATQDCPLWLQYD